MTPPTPALNQRTTFWLALTFALVVTAACGWIVLHPEWIEQFQTWGYVGAFVINLVSSATLVLPVPGAWLVVAMSTALNPILLSIISGVGSAIGELTGYVAGSTGQVLVPPSQQKRYEQIHTAAEKYGAWVLFALAAFPFPLFDLAGIVAGVTKMRVWQFLIATAAGKTIKYAIMIAFGAGPLELFQQWLRS